MEVLAMEASAMEVSAIFDLAQLPLILAGPILRRTEPEAVSVWIALQAPAKIQLQVIPTNAQDIDKAQPLLQGTASTVTLGKSLHVALITAQPLSAQTLVPGQLYAYDIKIYPHQDDHNLSDFSPESTDTTPLSLQQALRSSRFPDVCVSYFEHGLPTFSLPPQDLNNLRILHGSCRKLHDRELDALPIVDQMIAEAAACPDARPHQLFFTGDQIYGDEVADAFLWSIQQLQPILFGWQETVLDDIPEVHSSHLKPGERKDVAEHHAGLTASLQGDDHKTQSHLLRFSEYCTSYLFSWSECFWQFRFPPAAAVGRTGKAAKLWNQQVAHLHETALSQVNVRRALANVPVYMIFDDHDVSDDWNLNQDWCLRVLGKPLGRQVVRNALLSYTLFQGWGNTPEQFFPNTIGANLLAATESWCRSQGTDTMALETIQQAIGMPLIDPITDLPQFQKDEDVWILRRSEDSLTWHYRIAGAAHEVIVLDTRTQRGYPIDPNPETAPHLLSPTAFKQQLRSMLQVDESQARNSTELESAAPAKITFIVSPTNVFTLEIIDRIQRLGLLYDKTYDMDIGDSWNLESSARLRLMQEVFHNRQKVIVLSGDIHFGAALRIDYWHHPNQSANAFARSQIAPDACLVQLVASAICNSELLTEILQTKIKLPFSERLRYWVGYADENRETEITPGFWRSIGHWVSAIISPKQRQRSKQFAQQPINWGYRSQWLHRQPAQSPTWQQVPAWLQPLQNQPQSLNLLRRLWHWRWLQEGKEVVGLNNIGLVQLRWPSASKAADQTNHKAADTSHPIVVYDLYWYAPWKLPHVVYSRFQTVLHPKSITQNLQEF
jgi:hypothetical protein